MRVNVVTYSHMWSFLVPHPLFGRLGSGLQKCKAFHFPEKNEKHTNERETVKICKTYLFNPLTVAGALKRLQFKKNWLLEIAFQFFVSAFLECYSSCKK